MAIGDKILWKPNRVIRFGDPDWVDPESPEFDQKSDKAATYQLRPKKDMITQQGR